MIDRRLRLLAPLLTLSAMPAQAASLAEMVMTQAAAIPSRSTDFVEEKRLASLTAPLISRGRLAFTRPSHLEKNTEAPKPEHLVIDGDRLTITEDREAPRTVSLDEHPALRALADTLRATLSGDLAALRRIYAIEEQGSPQSWRLVLVPRDLALRRTLARVTLDGSEADLRQIVIQQTNGDEQRLIMSVQK
jgi:outer membrane lipoprotein-sorting protein